MHLDDPKLTIAEAGEIAGGKPATASLWFRNKWIGWETDRAAAVAGATTIVSGRTVLALTIAIRLRSLGMPPEAACKAARRFTDRSNGHEAPGFERNPGELFDGSTTCLVADRQGEVLIVRADGIKKRRQKPGTREFETIDHKPTLQEVILRMGEGACWVLHLDPIVQHVESELAKYDERRRA